LHFRTEQAQNHRGNRIGQVEPSYSQTLGPKVKFIGVAISPSEPNTTLDRLEFGNPISRL